MVCVCVCVCVCGGGGGGGGRRPEAVRDNVYMKTVHVHVFPNLQCSILGSL